MNTFKMIYRLMLLWEDRDKQRLEEAADWLLSTHKGEVSEYGPKGSYGIPANHMYLISPRGKEFRSSLKERLEWDPKQLCYNHLGMIRNGIAIHTLIKLRQPVSRDNSW